MKFKKIVFALLAMTLIFTGCKGKNSAEAVNEEKNTEESAVSQESTEGERSESASEDKNASLEEKKDIKKEDVIKEALNLKGSYDIKFDDSDVYTFEYDYVIPEITDGSAEALLINNEIYDEVKNSVEYVQDVKSGKETEVYESDLKKVEYNCSQKGDVISIVVIKYGTYSDWVDYAIFNYDVVNQKRVTNDEIIELSGFTEEEFLKYCRNQASKKSSENIEAFAGSIPEEEINNPEYSYLAKIMPSLINDHISTICDKAINTEMPIYFDENGDLSAIAAIYVPAGAGLFYTPLKLDRSIEDLSTAEYKEYAEKLYYKGFEHDCMGLYESDGYSLDTSLDGKDRYFYLGFTGKENDIFLYQDSLLETTEGYEGSIKWEDADEKGSLYSFELTKLDGKELADADKKSGKFYLLNHNEYDEENDIFDDGATYTYVEGFDLFESEGREVDLSRSQG